MEVKDLILSKKSESILSTEDTIILKGINAEFKPGKINGIVAPNGSGKTTFLNAIYGLSSSGTKTSGTILFNGEERNPETWFDEASFVEDTYFEFQNQTVEEILNFVIEIQKSKSQEYENLDEIIEGLSLNDLLSMRYSYLSAGQKKRVLIARDLIAGKKVLILDEPLANLDTHIAVKFMNYLKEKAEKKNITVIITVHFIPERIMKMLDYILVFYNGFNIYSGDTNDELTSFFDKYNLKKPENYSVSEFLIEMLYGNYSVSKELSPMQNDISKMIKDSKMQCLNKLSVGDLRSQSYQNLFDWKFSKSSYWSLLKRFISIASKWDFFYISVIISAFIAAMFTIYCNFMLMKRPIASFPISFDNLNEIFGYSTVFDLLFGSNLIMKNTHPLEFELAKSYVTTLVRENLIQSCIMGAFISSPFLNMRYQILNEISKGFYNGFTFFLSYISIEILFRLVVVFITIAICFSTCSFRLLSFQDLLLSLLFSILLPIGQSLISALHLRESLFIQLASFGFNYLFLIFSFLFTACNSNFFKFSILNFIVKSVSVCLAFLLSPSYFLSYIFKNQHNAAFEESLLSRYPERTNEIQKFFSIPRKIFNAQFVPLINESKDLKKGIYVLILSLAIIMLISSLLFSNYFNPRISLSPKPKAQQKKTWIPSFSINYKILNRIFICLNIMFVIFIVCMVLKSENIFKRVMSPKIINSFSKI